MTSAADTAPTAPAPRRDRTHHLYIAVIIAVALGIAVGFAAPGTAEQLKPLGTGFVNLIKMMITPIIFCTIVTGVGSIRSAARVGKLGGMALGYFIAMSFVALAMRAGLTMLRGRTRAELAGADMAISPPIGESGWMRPARIPEFARAGEEAVYQALPELKRLLGLEADPAPEAP